jgi:hypothetical protein
MTNHPQELVIVGEMEAEIDVDIAPLIKLIWEYGLATSNCCQENHPGIVWIEFLTELDAVQFLNIVAGEFSNEMDSLYNRIRRKWEPEDVESLGWWKFEAFLRDDSVMVSFDDDGNIDETPFGNIDFQFSISVRFPRTDLEIATQRMMDAQ